MLARDPPVTDRLAAASQQPSAAALGSLHWDPVPLSILNNGHAVQVNDSAPSSLVLEGVKYSLVQFHFHAPAEHTFDGHAFDAELHLVHRAPDGKLAVVALMFRSGADNPALRPVLDAIPMDPAPEHLVAGQTVDVGALMPKAPRFLSYDGSLTTPPCTEGVRWLVVVPDPTPLEMTPNDLARLRAAMHSPTNRPPQPAQGRSIDLRTL